MNDPETLNGLHPMVYARQLVCEEEKLEANICRILTYLWFESYLLRL